MSTPSTATSCSPCGSFFPFISSTFSAGAYNVVTPARAAALAFAGKPSTASTRPVSDNSPVNAYVWSTGTRVSAETSATNIGRPMDGPPLGGSGSIT